MAYQTGKTIEQVVGEIEQKKYLLPSIQREYVWDLDQIETLFDSLMRGYPINSFLFWLVKKEKMSEYQFYNFLSEYSEEKIYSNQKASTDGKEEVVAVLDGQQRLTSLYLGLKGTYATRLKYKWKGNSDNYPKRRLYLNLFKESEKETMIYDFVFLTKEELKKAEKDKTNYYFRVGEILDYNVDQIYDYADAKFDEFDKEVRIKARNNLRRLHDTIKTDPVIFEYLELEQDLDKVLNIFIRTNSGGTKLAYSDLLLSIASSQWTTDAREEIIGLVNDINEIGNKFDVDKDFVLKSSLVLADIPSVIFNVSNFNRANMGKIESNWEAIKQSLLLTFGLISDLGYQAENLPSNNAVIPIAYYIHKKGFDSSFSSSSKYAEDRILIRKWLAVALLKRVFGGQPDNVLTNIRKIIQESNTPLFPAKEIVNDYRNHPSKSFTFDEESIKSLMDSSKYGNKYTFSLLQFLYPTFDFSNKFHIDHIHPKSFSSKKVLKEKEITLNSIVYGYFKNNVNNLPNLQLLEGTLNIEKSNQPFEAWYNNQYKNADQKTRYNELHYIPSNKSYKLESFQEFYEEREKIIYSALYNRLVEEGI
ncbi:MAG: DUF262 domain-containing protein [Bacilli bacterium]|nr:DUF262 domain-containing protein [Bacilli bacterium]